MSGCPYESGKKNKVYSIFSVYTEFFFKYKQGGRGLFVKNNYEKMVLRKILVLGADGFIGSNLVKSLHKEGKYKIFAFDLFKDGISRNLDCFDDNLIMIQGNFLNREDLKKSLKGVDYVFHFISLTTPGSSMDDPLIEIDANIRGTVSLFELCVENKVKRIVFASSGGAIYGDQNKKIYDENDRTDPISPYAISKLTIEKFLKYFKKHFGLDYLILRYSNPYGPGQNVVGSQGIISIFLNLVKQNKPITIFGDGENIRDYIYIDDLVNITKRIFDKKTRYSIYNVGSGKNFKIKEIVEAIKKVTGKKIKVNKLPKRDIDVRKISLNIKRIKKEAAYKNFYSLENGIEKSWKWIKNLQ